MRRFALALLVSLSFVFTMVLPAWAGSYLDRASLMLDQAHNEGDVLQPRTFDKELVLVIRAMAETRARVARKMEVPAAVAKAHPHLLLVLENYERAASAANDGNFKKFVEYVHVARDEDRNFRAILKELGFALPNMAAKPSKR
jgi:hypothetical protein